MESAYNQAKKEAIEKVLLEIAASGNPTDAQIRFIREFKPKPDELDEIGKALKLLDAFLGIGGER